MNAELTIAMLRLEANVVAFQVAAERALKEARAVINDYKSFVARMRHEASYVEH
jgi:hypothetical protein